MLAIRKWLQEHRTGGAAIALAVTTTGAACSERGGGALGTTDLGNAGALGRTADAGRRSDAQGAGGALPSSGGSSGGAGRSETGGSAGRAAAGGADDAGGVQAAGGAAGGAGTTSVGGAGHPDSGATPSAGGLDGSDDGGMGTAHGTCCTDGDCLCHGPDPTGLTSRDGPFVVGELRARWGTVYYPTDAQPPFAAIVLCGRIGSSGLSEEIEPWATLYASHGIVTGLTNVLATEIPAERATKLLAAVDNLRALNADGESPFSGRLSGRYGVSGISMCGGAALIAARTDPTLKSSVALSPWSSDGAGVGVPTLLVCGLSDTTAPCSMSEAAYATVDDSVPKMMISIFGATHFSFIYDRDAAWPVAAEYGLAFHKVYLDGDARWSPLLIQAPATGTQKTNIRTTGSGISTAPE